MIMEMKVSPRSVQQETVRMVREAITSGYFKPGEKLVEAKLCSMLGVSRTSVREALRVLSAEKLITIVPNKGPSVAEVSWDEAENIYQLRALLEGETAALAAGLITVEDLARMRKALDSFQSAVKGQNWKGRVNATADFYEIMIEACGNSVMGDVIHGLLTRINFLRAKTMASPGRDTHSAEELEAIYDALQRHNVRDARAAAVAHVKAAEAIAREVYTTMGQDD
jgi:DNA-binding GntR family transcriptional regulator